MIIKSNVAVSENGFVFDPSTGDSFTLNNTGKEILFLIREGKGTDQITSLLIDKYDTDKETAERYLVDFINDLRINNLLED